MLLWKKIICQKKWINYAIMGIGFENPSVFYLRHPHGWPEIMSWASRDRHRHRHRDRDRHRAKHLTGPEVSVMFLGDGWDIRLMNGIIILERHSHTLSLDGWLKFCFWPSYSVFKTYAIFQYSSIYLAWDFTNSMFRWWILKFKQDFPWFDNNELSIDGLIFHDGVALLSPTTIMQ